MSTEHETIAPDGATASTEDTPRQAIYTPLPEGSRPVAWWWSILQILLMFVLSLAGGLLVAFAMAVGAVCIAMINGTFDPSTNAEPPGWVIGVAIVSFLFGMFITMMLTAIVKVKMERRSLATAGMSGFMYGSRFWGGFFGGIGLAALLIVPSAIAGMIFGMPDEMGTITVENIMTGQFAIAMVILLVFLMIQAPAEEVFMRGWLMSALSWRHGLITAVIVSSLIFCLLHSDRVVAGFGWLIYTLIAVGSVGVLFAAVAYATRSVYPSAGLHTGYNFTFIALALAVAVMQSESSDIMTALMEVMDMASMDPFEASPVMIVDLIGRGAIPLAIAWWLFTKPRKSAIGAD